MVSVPTIQWIEQSTATDPSGFRHLSNPAKGFIKNLGTGPGQQLDFGAVDISVSGQVSDTKLVYARVSNYNGASGIYNLKHYLSNITAFGVGTYRFLERKSFQFLPNLRLTEADTDTPTTLPGSPNVLGTYSTPFPLGQASLSGLLDTDVTQYIYLAVFIDDDVPLGKKGGAGAGTFRRVLQFDFS